MENKHLSDLITGDLDVSDIIEMHKYHDDPSKEARYQDIRDACVYMMVVVQDNCPKCFDRTMAFQAIRQVRMLANSAIALERHKK
jgi:hypothetical protein